MKVVFTSQNLKSKYKDFRKKQDEKIIKNAKTK